MTLSQGTFIAELQRRRVFRVLVGYGVVSFALLQVIEPLMHALHLPDAVLTYCVIALGLGFPIALVLAWAFDIKPGGIERTQPSPGAAPGPRGVWLAVVLVGLGLLAAAPGLAWYFLRAKEPAAAAAPAPPANGIAPDSKAAPSIAVLPFANRSDQGKDAYFVEGIHDDILTQLSKLSALKVISRTSVMRFRDTKLAIKEIGEQLGVASILEGGVQRAGDRVHITVQLIDAASDAHLWAETYDRELTAANVFAIQSEVALTIAKALKAALTPAEAARAKAVPTQDLEAWEAFQLGQQRLALRTSAGLVQAEKLIRKAIALDPGFALAHVALANSLTLRVEYSGADRASTLQAAQRVVDAALKLDPGLSEAWASSGLIAAYRRQATERPGRPDVSQGYRPQPERSDDAPVVRQPPSHCAGPQRRGPAFPGEGRLPRSALGGHPGEPSRAAGGAGPHRGGRSALPQGDRDRSGVCPWISRARRLHGQPRPTRGRGAS